MATAFAAALGVGITEMTGGRLPSPTEVRRTRELTGEIDQVLEPTGAQTLEREGSVAAVS
jgi:hypothetical protein